MKIKLLCFLTVTCGGILHAASPLEPPEIEWQRSFGGSDRDYLRCVLQTQDGGFLLAGNSPSGTNGNKTSPNFGGDDFWVIKLDTLGNELWQRSFGGSSNDRLYGVVQTSDSGLILVGLSESPPGGNKTSARLGASDAWVVRIDAEGNKLWDKSYGGTESERFISGLQVSDGGFLFGGSSSSDTNGSRTSPVFGNEDYWLVRTDAQGNQLWDRSFGGTNEDTMVALTTAPDGGYLLNGTSRSMFSGNKTTTNYTRTDALFSLLDYWVVHVSEGGEKIWEADFGGSRSDYARAIVPLIGGEFLVGGNTSSPADGNKTTPPFSNYQDYWVVRIDSSGNKLSELVFGGTGDDALWDLHQTSDGRVVVMGCSNSTGGGNKTSASYGGSDGWLIRLAATGEKLWELSLGGNADEGVILGYAGAATPTADGGILVGLYSTSPPSGNKTTGSFGLEDFWVVKLGPERYRVTPEARFADSGSVTLSPAAGADGRYAAYAPVSLTAIPSAGFAFAYWGENLAETNNPLELTVTSNARIRATFVRQAPIGLDHAPSALTGTLLPNQMSNSLPFSVWNPGGGILRYSNSVDVPWLSVIPTLGQSIGETNTHTLLINAAGLPFDTNLAGTITITPLDGVTPPQTLSVTVVRAGTAPRLSVTRQTYAAMQQSGFRFTVSGQSNAGLFTEYSTNLLDWSLLLSNRFIGGTNLLIVDPAATNSPRRFYRSTLVP